MDYTIPGIEKLVQPFINGGKIVKVDLSRLTAPGENYISLVFRADLELESQNGECETISAVAKRLPTAPLKGTFDFHAISMKMEIEWYSKIVPLFKSLAKEYGVECDYFPTYLGSRLSMDLDSHQPDAEAVLLVKNLRPEGYVNEDRHVGFDLKTATSILKSLAAFHATGFGIKYKQPQKFQIIKDTFKNAMPESEGPPPPGDGPPEHIILQKIIELQEFQPYKTHLRNLQNNLLPLVERYMGGGLEPWNTVAHGDFWGNNIMVKNGEPVAVKMLDFQACKYLTYARDVVFFLLTSLRDNVLRQDFDNLLRFYHEELTKNLDKIGIPELEITFQDLMDELKRVVAKHEALHALFFTAIIFAPKLNIPDYLTGEVDMFDHMKKMMDSLNARQRERLLLVVQTCVNKGWI